MTEIYVVDNDQHSRQAWQDSAIDQQVCLLDVRMLQIVKHRVHMLVTDRLGVVTAQFAFHVSWERVQDRNRGDATNNEANAHWKSLQLERVVDIVSSQNNITCNRLVLAVASVEFQVFIYILRKPSGLNHQRTCAPYEDSPGRPDHMVHKFVAFCGRGRRQSHEKRSREK